MTDEVLARILVEARHKANLSQNQLAKRMGTTQAVVSQLENARRTPTLTTLRKYAEATGMMVQVAMVPKKRKKAA
jgi:transcriptional regulator with XRE-family HTH domain